MKLARELGGGVEVLEAAGEPAQMPVSYRLMVSGTTDAELARRWSERPGADQDRLDRVWEIAGKYAHIPFSSEDLAREHRAEVEGDERRFRPRHARK
jgi:hypothetical protein